MKDKISLSKERLVELLANAIYHITEFEGKWDSFCALTDVIGFTEEELLEFMHKDDLEYFKSHYDSDN